MINAQCKKLIDPEVHLGTISQLAQVSPFLAPCCLAPFLAPVGPLFPPIAPLLAPWWPPVGPLLGPR